MWRKKCDTLLKTHMTLEKQVHLEMYLLLKKMEMYLLVKKGFN